MRKQQLENAAFDVATQVRAVEDSIDGALAEIAELQGRMMYCRSVSGMGIATGHDSLQHLANALQGLVNARGGMANCHAALVNAKQSVPGLRTVGFGETDECPKTAVADLRVVA